jgi:Eco29kI restriction endonuclease
MAKSKVRESDIGQVLREIVSLRKSLGRIGPYFKASDAEAEGVSAIVEASGALMEELKRVREHISPVRFGSIGITLGRSDSIAKFFAFSFINQEKRALAELIANPFYGAGVYAIYYKGNAEKAYLPLSGTETPIYVGKADPRFAYAETVESQGQMLFARLKEHAKNIAKTELDLADFEYRAAAIQSGMQASVEDFMIRLFRPIWNKEIRICYGIGKHGDSATTRANKRSPWDTMHPGRKWAVDTHADQMSRADIEAKIAAHLAAHPVISGKDALFKLLSLE